MKNATQYDVVLIGLGNAGSMIADAIMSRKKYNSIRFIAVSDNIYDLRKLSIKDKALLKDGQELKSIISKAKNSPTVIIVGEVGSAESWIKLLEGIRAKHEKNIFSFVIPPVRQSKAESDRANKRIVELSTRTLSVPVDLFKLYTKHAGNVSFKDLEEIARNFTKIAVNSFLFLYEQFFLLGDQENSGLVKRMVTEKGMMYFSLGSDSGDSMREAYHSALISEDNLKSSRMKLLHVQFKKPISLMTAHMLKKWVDKYHVDIRLDYILMERNPKIEDVALTRLWIFE